MLQLPQVMESVRLAQYLGAAGITVMLYDWILTLPAEIEFVWTQDRWNIPSALFLVVRITDSSTIAILWSSAHSIRVESLPSNSHFSLNDSS